MPRASSVDEYLDGLERWKGELTRLREVIVATELVETVKWGAPCYTFDDKIVVGMGSFKSYFALWFHQGALLKDKQEILINAQEGRTKALRQWRFQSKAEIKVRSIKTYLAEAIELARAGKHIAPERNKPVSVPTQLRQALAKDPIVKLAYSKLSLSRRREYADYITEAKRAETKQKRLDKILPMIAAEIGLNDKYRR